MFDIAAIPCPDRKKTGLLVGIGQTVVFPAATSRSAGQGAWQAGPAFGVICSGIRGLLLGFIAQNPIGFDYTSPHRHHKTHFSCNRCWHFICGASGTFAPRRQLVDGLASPLADDVATEFGHRPDVRSSRVILDELFCYRPVDGLSPVCPDCATDHNKFSGSR